MRPLIQPLNFEFLPLSDMVFPTDRRYTVLSIENLSTELVNTLTPLGLSIGSVVIFYSEPGFFRDYCHVDGFLPDDITQWPSRCKLNYTINGDKSELLFYDVDVDHRLSKMEKNTTIRGDNFFTYKLDNCSNICSISTNGWHLFEAGTPHTARNLSNIPRWNISMFIYETPVYLYTPFIQIRDKLEDYITSPSFNG